MHYLSALLFSRALLSEMFKKLLCAPKKGHRNHQPVRTNDVHTLHAARREFFLSIWYSRTFEILGVFSCSEYYIGLVIWIDVFISHGANCAHLVNSQAKVSENILNLCPNWFCLFVENTKEFCLIKITKGIEGASAFYLKHLQTL